MDTIKVSPLIEDPKQLLLDMASQRNAQELLSLAVQRLAGSPNVALARIWLVKPGEGCATCLMQSECPDRTNCLHLAASCGSALENEAEHYDRLDGAFRRFPLGVRKVGRIAATGVAIEVPDLNDTPEWIARPEWISSEQIQGFGGQPLVHRGTVLGVLALFSRSRIGSNCFDWLRMIADHAAAAIANAQAWEEIETLRRRLELENQYLQEEVENSWSLGDLVGNSPPMRSLGRQIELVAPTEATVLITGESGTGKELIAREIHRRSSRAGRPLIRVNCAAIPRELYESEFFGHVRGAFTGALRDRTGRFELAHGGTLFLDEVGEIPLELQSKLLRVLQEGELERVGEERTRHIDVRIIAATNRNLKEETERGRFRADLFYRLGVFPIEAAPLRKRKEDLPALAKHFLTGLAQRMGRTAPRLTLANVQRLQRYDWPGNVRELQHVIERALIISTGNTLNLEDLRGSDAVPESGRSPQSPNDAEEILTEIQLRAQERENLRRALLHTRGKVYGPGGAAELLGIKPTTLMSRIKTFGIQQDRNG